jgi:hypothetical protein
VKKEWGLITITHNIRKKAAQNAVFHLLENNRNYLDIRYKLSDTR